MFTFYLIVILFFGWGFFSISYIRKLSQSRDPNTINEYLYDSIPPVFTTIGVFGTFVGICFGLWEFDVNNITASIPILLEGLKTAFLTSILGLFLSFFFARISQSVLYHAEKHIEETADEKKTVNNHGDYLKTIANTLEQNQKLFIQRFDKFSQLQERQLQVAQSHIQLSQKTHDFLQNHSNKQSDLLIKIGQLTSYIRAEGGQRSELLIKEMHKLSERLDPSALVELTKQSTEQIGGLVTNLQSIRAESKQRHELLTGQLRQLGELLEKNDTDMLVEMMQQATETFNKQMSTLVERLVQENFSALNNSVQQLNDWQQENKEMVAKLVAQFSHTVEKFETGSQAITNITRQTERLVAKDSHLTRLIQELQKAMIDDTRFSQIVEKINMTVNILRKNTIAFDETTNKLNNWVKSQMYFSDSVEKLLTRLENIDRMKDLNDIFWKETKEKMNEGVAIINGASESIKNDLENIDAQFHEQLNDLLASLEALILRIIEQHNR